MKKILLTLSLVITCAAFISAQNGSTSTSARGSSSSTVTEQGRQLDIQSGTTLAAQLENSLDVRKAKVGDRVVLRTTEAIQANGQTVIKKGARLVGRVTDVQQRAKSGGESHVGLLFDQLENGSTTMPLTAVVTSVIQARAVSPAGDDMLGAEGRGQASAGTRSSRSSSAGGGGLLGGVTNTVGGVLNSTTETATGVVSATGDTVGSATSTVGSTVGGIRVSESTTASAEGGSTLSLTGDNLRLEKGTMFRLRLDQAGSAGTERQP
jgi:hypothetical protein